MASLEGKVALVTGASRGIGRAIAERLARDGAMVVVNYARSADAAREVVSAIETTGGRAAAVQADVSRVEDVRRLVWEIVERFGRLDILVNNAAEQQTASSIEEISTEQLERTFRTNIFAMFHLTKAALPHLGEGSAIINSTSVTAYRGSPSLLDYASTKGAIVAFTRSLSLQLVERGIRVNGVAPGPIWTPLIPATMPPDKVEQFGSQVPMGRPGQPEEVAPSYVFLASDDASYFSGQILHPNGGEVVNA